MVSACLMPPMFPEPNTSVWHGIGAFALSTMGRSRATGVELASEGEPHRHDGDG